MAYGKGGDVSDNGRGDRIGTSPHWVAEEKYNISNLGERHAAKTYSTI